MLNLSQRFKHHAQRVAHSSHSQHPVNGHVASTAVTWPGRLRQIHSFFRARSPDEMLDTAAPWTSPWLPPGYEQNFWNAA
jgi:hypothetical protein